MEVWIVPTLPHAVDQLFTGPAQAVLEAGILVFAVEAQADAVAAVDFVADLLTGPLQAIPTTLADRGCPFLAETVARDERPAAFDAVPGQLSSVSPPAVSQVPLPQEV